MRLFQATLVVLIALGMWSLTAPVQAATTSHDCLNETDQYAKAADSDVEQTKEDLLFCLLRSNVVSNTFGTIHTSAYYRAYISGRTVEYADNKQSAFVPASPGVGFSSTKRALATIDCYKKSTFNGSIDNGGENKIIVMNPERYLTSDDGQKDLMTSGIRAYLAELKLPIVAKVNAAQPIFGVQFSMDNKWLDKLDEAEDKPEAGPCDVYSGVNIPKGHELYDQSGLWRQFEVQDFGAQGVGYDWKAFIQQSEGFGPGGVLR